MHSPSSRLRCAPRTLARQFEIIWACIGANCARATRGSAWKSFDRIFLIAVGKAAEAMARGS